MQVPLSTVASFVNKVSPLTINHQGVFPSVTLSFNLAPGVALGDAVEQIDKVRRELNMPFTVQGAFHDRHRQEERHHDDFALDAERSRAMSPLAAIREACLLRFRPIMMTTFAAIGIAIGGLLVSQWLTLDTTPVVYLYLDRLSGWLTRRGGHRKVAVEWGLAVDRL